jgi:hypothetical protein
MRRGEGHTGTATAEGRGGRGANGDGVSRPYSATEAAALLGVSHDTLTRHFESLHGFRLGARVLFPRWAVDRLVADPDGGHAGAAEESPAETRPVERVLALLALLSTDDLRAVTRAILAREVA